MQLDLMSELRTQHQEVIDSIAAHKTDHGPPTKWPMVSLPCTKPTFLLAHATGAFTMW